MLLENVRHTLSSDWWRCQPGFDFVSDELEVFKTFDRFGRESKVLLAGAALGSHMPTSALMLCMPFCAQQFLL